MSQAEEGGVGAEDVGPSGQPSRTHGPTRAAHASVKGEDHTNTTNDDDTILRCRNEEFHVNELNCSIYRKKS